MRDLFGFAKSSPPFEQYHKLNAEPYVNALGKDPVRQNALVNELAIGSVAMKSVAA